MAKVTSKLQVTIPKRVAEEFGIAPGDEIQWVPSGETIRVVPQGRAQRQLGTKERLRLFDEATRRQRKRERTAVHAPGGRVRGWSREELYERGRAR
jgi:AbrB family looped-hinge helix DNA binding protein